MRSKNQEVNSRSLHSCFSRISSEVSGSGVRRSSSQARTTITGSPTSVGISSVLQRAPPHFPARIPGFTTVRFIMAHLLSFVCNQKMQVSRSKKRLFFAKQIIIILQSIRYNNYTYNPHSRPKGNATSKLV